MSTKRNVIQMTTLKIDKNVPMPPPKQGKNHWGFASNMAIGDSFFLPFKTYSKHAAGSFRNWAGRNLGKLEFQTRSYDDGVRIWRTK